MRPMHTMRVRTARGFAAIAAIFLLVVLAALGAYMLTFSNTQQLTSAQDVQGARGYWAARAGLEWAIAHISAQPVATADCPPAQTLPGGTATFDGGFTVAVSCVRQNFTEAGATVRIFRIDAVARTAAAAGSVGYVERSLSATMER